ncbi:MAG: hypothetical protein AVDCRST_MAG41-2750 [uncultured Corynebacteriales bacterium]|uniref:Glyoxalase-like domain-containing protein n=1 Tax=uncultured Mycobacteriales bacterium TaxID=581187 RepID=A0A6J4J594_9ACTN|nr:MAG: hypothetical protein AVDCRST_MAG41-2750 [uncultured Corynebacteriales bacterium]
MAYDLQVVIDTADPHGLADWWAATLGWVVEPSDEGFIRSMIDAGHASAADTTTHRGVLVWKEGAAITHPAGTAGGRPRILFQLVPEAKTVKNRVHLDLRGEGDGDPEATIRALLDRGATLLHRGSQGPARWATLADPEGNEFCVPTIAPPS